MNFCKSSVDGVVVGGPCGSDFVEVARLRGDGGPRCGGAAGGDACGAAGERSVLAQLRLAEGAAREVEVARGAEVRGAVGDACDAERRGLEALRGVELPEAAAEAVALHAAQHLHLRRYLQVGAVFYTRYLVTIVYAMSARRIMVYTYIYDAHNIK